MGAWLHAVCLFVQYGSKEDMKKSNLALAIGLMLASSHAMAITQDKETPELSVEEVKALLETPELQTWRPKCKGGGCQGGIGF
jgi:hypothetical protein